MEKANAHVRYTIESSEPQLSNEIIEYMKSIYIYLIPAIKEVSAYEISKAISRPSMSDCIKLATEVIENNTYSILFYNTEYDRFRQYVHKTNFQQYMSIYVAKLNYKNLLRDLYIQQTQSILSIKRDFSEIKNMNDDDEGSQDNEGDMESYSPTQYESNDI